MILKLKFRQDFYGEKIFCVGKKLVKLSTCHLSLTDSLTPSLISLIFVMRCCCLVEILNSVLDRDYEKEI